MVQELTEKDFNEFIKSNEFVLVDFWADWCMPCIMMAPVIEDISKKLEPKGIKFAKVDVSENQGLAAKYNVRSIPNFILFHRGEVKERFVGAMSPEDFEERLKAVA